MTRQVLLMDRPKAVLRAVPPDTRRRLKRALAQLAPDPTGRKAGLDVAALDLPPGSPTTFRLAVGSFRVAFLVQPRLIRVLRVFHRSEGYGWLGD
jgi:hypothetical protein